MADTAPVDTGDLWKWVDRLTRERTHRVVRHEHGRKARVQWVKLSSLHDQLVDAQASSNSGGGHGKASAGSRAPLDLTITSLLADIASRAVDALASHEVALHYKDPEQLAQPQRPASAPTLRRHDDGEPVVNPDLAGRLVEWSARRTGADPDVLRALGIRVLDVQACLRTLAATVVTTRDADLIDWWTDRFRSWVLRAEEALALEDDDVLDSRPVRGVACPDCGVDYVWEDRDGEDYRQPALVITFRDGQVVHITCRHCTKGWWRGEEIQQLGLRVAASIPTPRPAEPERLPTIVLGVTYQDAFDYIAAREISEPTLAVSLRAPDSVRGRTAAGLVATPQALAHPRYEHALAICRPCLAVGVSVHSAGVS